MATAAAPHPVAPEPELAPAVLKLVFGAYLIVLNLILLYLMFKIWPGKVPSSNGELPVSVLWGRITFYIGPEKRYLGIKVGVVFFNTIVLIGSTLVLLGLLHWILRRQLEVRRS